MKLASRSRVDTALLPVCLALTAAALSACPRPLDVTRSLSGTQASSGARVPRDTVVELTLPRLADGQALLADLLTLLDVEEGLAFGARQELASMIGIDPLRPALFSLAALDPERAVVVALRPRGGTFVRLPSRDPGRSLTALALTFGARLDRAPHDDGAAHVQIARAPDGNVRALVRSENDAVVLVLDPEDALAEHALLARHDDNALYRPARAPTARAALFFSFTRGALTFLDERVRVDESDSVLVDGDVAREVGGLVLRARFPGERAPDDGLWRSGCRIVDDALVRARVPSDLFALLLGEDERLRGPVEIFFLPRDAAVRAPVVDDGELLSSVRLVVVGRPRDDDAVRSLRESLGVTPDPPWDAVVERVSPSGPEGGTLAARIESERFILSTGGRGDIDTITTATTCARDDGLVLIDGARARAALRPPSGPVSSASGAFRRVLWRALTEVESVRADIVADRGATTVRLDVRPTRAPGKPADQAAHERRPSHAD